MFKKIVLLIGLSFMAFAFLACDKKEQEKKPEKIVKPSIINVHTLEEKTYPIWVQFSGKTQAVDEVLVTSRVTGELEKKHFKPGDLVQKGQILFNIDKSEYQAVWDQKNATLAKDKASLSLANANVKRYEPLVKEQLAPREKLDELVASKLQLDATIKADEAALESATLDLEYCDVKSSIKGRIGKELVLVGNLVDKGTQLAQIVQTDYLYVNFNPSAHEVALINTYKSEEKPKVKVSLRSTKLGTVELEGEIDFVDNVSNASTGTVAMRAKIVNTKNVLFPGTFVQVSLFVTDQLPVLAIHPDQISQSQQGEFVNVLDKQNKIQARQIKTGYSNNDMVIIQEGIKVGDRVLVDAINTLNPSTIFSAKEVADPIKL